MLEKINPGAVPHQSSIIISPVPVKVGAASGTFYINTKGKGSSGKSKENLQNFYITSCS